MKLFLLVSNIFLEAAPSSLPVKQVSNCCLDRIETKESRQEFHPPWTHHAALSPTVPIGARRPRHIGVSPPTARPAPRFPGRLPVSDTTNASKVYQAPVVKGAGPQGTPPEIPWIYGKEWLHDAERDQVGNLKGGFIISLGNSMVVLISSLIQRRYNPTHLTLDLSNLWL